MSGVKGGHDRMHLFSATCIELFELFYHEENYSNSYLCVKAKKCVFFF
jgi:hypothetical protein